MGILKSAADLVFTIRFLKLLVTPFEKTGAFKAGIIDKDGKRIKDFDMNKGDNRDAYREHYTPFIRLVMNLKRLLAKVPGGQSAIARYGSALLLIKEHGNLSDKDLMKIHEATGVDILDCLAEESKWFMVEGNRLSPGIYRMKNGTVTTEVEEIVQKGDKIRVLDVESLPIGEFQGIDIYKGIHENSKQWVYFTTGEITR
tara:strand:- start:8251 stop:8850 length:600 start_codon:yes stop_codon:yes gene_type:complete